MRNEVEVRGLRYLVAVAEELNFGRAARRLVVAWLETSVAARLPQRLTALP